MSSRRPALWASILASFLGVALLQAWPLPLHMSTTLTGDPSGDTGTYVWNLWVFRHELVDQGTTPFKTSTILPLDGPADLSLHNYTVAADALALPLVPWVGIVAAFNTIYLLNVALAGFGTYLLARHVHRSAGIGTGEAWLGGVAFACSPYLVSRSEGHFSLAAAAALPFFALAFDRAWTDRRARDAAAAGASMAWAGFCDPYYAIYCVMLGGVLIAAHDMRFYRAPAHTRRRTLRVALDALLVLAAVVIVLLVASDASSVSLGSMRISTTSLYTPTLALTLLACARLMITLRPRVRWTPTLTPRESFLIVAVMGVVAGAILLPQLLLIAKRVMNGRMVHASVLWRSSAPGLDVVSYFVPNPNNPLVPDLFRDWTGLEFQGALSWVAMLVVVAALARRLATPATRLWAGVTLLFAVLALGPFVQIGGLNTYLPAPWALLRYVPVISEARMPSRMAVVVSMALAIAFTGALAGLVRQHPARRRHILLAVGVALAFELLPIPRELHAADIPAIYQTIAADPGPGVVLDLPFGVRDGLQSLGYFGPRAQFHQTLHHKPLLGGYLSRVSEHTKQLYLASPFIRTLMDLSDPTVPVAPISTDVLQGGAEFLSQTGVRYVVIDRAHTRQELRAFAIDALRLERVGESDGYELYKPRSE